MSSEKRRLVRELLAALAERPVWALPLLAARVSPAAAADSELLKPCGLRIPQWRASSPDLYLQARQAWQTSWLWTVRHTPTPDYQQPCVGTPGDCLRCVKAFSGAVQNCNILSEAMDSVMLALRTCCRSPQPHMHAQWVASCPTCRVSCSAGPWKGLWVRRGYDPRLDPRARQWQALELPVPPAWCAQASPPSGMPSKSECSISTTVRSSTSSVSLPPGTCMTCSAINDGPPLLI